MVSRLIMVMLILQGCFPGQVSKPEDVLKKFINIRFSEGQTKDKLLELTTGDMKAKLEAMDEEKFKKFTNTGMYRLKNVRIVLKSCTNSHCSLTYVLSYSKTDKADSLLTEIKKIAEFDQTDAGWKLKGVSTVKTYFESDIPIEAP